MNFSQRSGLIKVPSLIEKNAVSEKLANSLWSVIYKMITHQQRQHDFHKSFFESIWLDYLKEPIDSLIFHGDFGFSIKKPTAKIRDVFFKADWNEKLDFVEFCATRLEDEFCQFCNNFFQIEMSAYRFVDKQIVELTSEEEILAIEAAIKDTNKFAPVQEHLKSSVVTFSNRENPDYRNSIKESISAVEAIARIITGNDKATLGDALNKVAEHHKIHGSLKVAFSKIYGYTSDEGGIRHSLTEGSGEVAIEDARFMLVTCSAFVNYLIDKTQVTK
jgi:AbiJ N-terminal domain 4